MRGVCGIVGGRERASGCILPAVGYLSGPPPCFLPARSPLPLISFPVWLHVHLGTYCTVNNCFPILHLSALGTGPHSKGPVIHFQAHQPPDHGRSLPVESYCPHRQLINPQDRAGGFHQTPPPHLPYHFIQVLLVLQPCGLFDRSILASSFVSSVGPAQLQLVSLPLTKDNILSQNFLTTAWTGELGWPGKVITGVRLEPLCGLQ